MPFPPTRTSACNALPRFDPGPRAADAFIGEAGRAARHRDAAPGALVQAECVRGAGEFEIDQLIAVGNQEADRSRQLIGNVLQAKLVPTRRVRPWTSRS